MKQRGLLFGADANALILDFDAYRQSVVVFINGLTRTVIIP